MYGKLGAQAHFLVILPLIAIALNWSNILYRHLGKIYQTFQKNHILQDNYAFTIQHKITT